jgi:hypothetical protein
MMCTWQVFSPETTRHCTHATWDLDLEEGKTMYKSCNAATPLPRQASTGQSHMQQLIADIHHQHL